jgi:transcription termination factor Rho
MSVLDRDALAKSPLADLHLLANELGLDGFRRLRKADLIDALVERQGGEPAPAEPREKEEGEERNGRARARGRGRGRAARDRDEDAAAVAEPVVAEPVVADPADAVADEPEDVDDDESGRGRRSRRGGRSRARGSRAGEGAVAAEDGAAEDKDEAAERVAEGTVELLANGSGFLRVAAPETSDDDVYISAAQIKRCELVPGDRIAGPVRRPRRSERFPSLVRIDTINGRPADEVAEGTRFEDLSVGFPDERFELGGDDSTLKAIEWLTPFGKGSRVTIVGASRAGKSEALRRIAGALAGRDGLELIVALAGVRPEEVGDWRTENLPAPVSSLSFAASADAQGQAVEQAVEQARRVAARGGDAVVVIDTLEYVSPTVARRTLAAARNITGGGSLTIIATAPAPIGGETTVIALDAIVTGLRRFPALDLPASGTLRPELLVGEEGAEAIAKARAEALV